MINDQTDGSVLVLTFRGPFPGIISDVPSLSAVPSACDDALNVNFRDGRIEPRPRMTRITGPVTNAGVHPQVVGIGSFKDITNALRVLYVTPNGAVYDSNPSLTIGSLAGFSTDSVLPCAFVGAFRKLYFSNGGSVIGNKIYYADGTGVAGVAAATFSARFLMILGGSLIAGYTNEGGTDYPYRIRWSNSGVPTSWPAGNYSDLVEVEDDITGMCKVGYYGYITRSDGITLISPTGTLLPPFALVDISSALAGVGCKYPYTLAAYGTFFIFAAEDDIYKFEQNFPQPIGGPNRRRIFADLLANLSNGEPAGIGTIVPFLYNTAVTSGGYQYPPIQGPFYLLACNNGVLWVYNIRDSSWTRYRPGQYTDSITSIAKVASPSDVVGKEKVLYATYSAADGSNLLAMISYEDNPYLCEDSGFINFVRHDWTVEQKRKVVNRIAVVYEDIGQAELTVLCTSGGQTVTAYPNPIKIGSVAPDGKVKRAWANINPLDAEFLSTQISFAAAKGLFSLVRVEGWFREGGTVVESS